MVLLKDNQFIYNVLTNYLVLVRKCKFCTKFTAKFISLMYSYTHS